MTTHTSEYTVKDTCLAIQLENGNIIFADKVVRISADDFEFVPRIWPGYKPRNETGTISLHPNQVREITIGICQR